MAIWEINGVAMPSPSGFDIAYKVNGKAELAASGDTVMDRLSIKKKITITYSHLFLDPILDILENTVSGAVFFDVAFFDPAQQQWMTGTYRMTDFQLPALRYEGMTPKSYQNVKLILEER